MGILVWPESEVPIGCKRLIELIPLQISECQPCKINIFFKIAHSKSKSFWTSFTPPPNWFDSRRVFNQGLPEQFGFVTTFRSKKDARSRWHIIRITDARKNPQFAVALNPKRKTVELSLPKYDRTLQTLTWDVPQVIFFSLVHSIIQVFIFDRVYFEIAFAFLNFEFRTG